MNFILQNTVVLFRLYLLDDVTKQLVQDILELNPVRNSNNTRYLYVDAYKD